MLTSPLPGAAGASGTSAEEPTAVAEEAEDEDDEVVASEAPLAAVKDSAEVGEGTDDLHLASRRALISSSSVALRCLRSSTMPPPSFPAPPSAVAPPSISQAFPRAKSFDSMSWSDACAARDREGQKGEQRTEK